MIKDGFQKRYNLNKDKYGPVIFVAALVVPRTGSPKSNGCATLLSHYVEGLLTQWLGTLDDSVPAAKRYVPYLASYPFAGGNTHHPYSERPRNTVERPREDELAERRRRYSLMSPQQRAERKVRRAIRRASLSPEKKEDRRTCDRLLDRARRARYTEEDKEREHQAAVKRWADRGPEGRKEAISLNTLYRQNEPEEKKEKHRAQMRARGVERNASRKKEASVAIGKPVPTTCAPKGWGCSFRECVSSHSSHRQNPASSPT